MNLRKRLVEGLVLAFSLSAYQLIGQPWYNDWLKSSGHTAGIFETAAGYAVVIFGTWFISGFLTRHMDSEHE